MLILGGRLKECLLGHFGLIKRLTTLLGRAKCVLFTENGILSRNRAKSHFEGTIQAGQNRDFGTSQTGTCGRLPMIKFCLQTIMASKQ